MRGWKLSILLAGTLALEASSRADEFPQMISGNYFRPIAADPEPETAETTGPRPFPEPAVIQSGYKAEVNTDPPRQANRAPAASRELCAPQVLPRAPVERRPCQCPTCIAQRQCPPAHHAAIQSQPLPPAYPQGMFVAPQGRGEVAGESRSLGFRGFAIEFPAIRLELPTIQLPSCIRFRREPEMRVAETYAPYVPGQPALYGQIAPGGAAQVAPQMQAAPLYRQPPVPPCESQPYAAPEYGPQSCETATGQIHQQIEQTTQSIEDLKSKLEQLQEIEKELRQLTDEQEKLLRDIRNRRSSKPPVHAPAPASSERFYFPN